MVTSISKKLLIVALTLSTLACSQLDAMENPREALLWGKNQSLDKGQEDALNSSPEEILNFIMNACKTLNMNQETIVNKIRERLKEYDKDICNISYRKALRLAVENEELDSVKIICLLAGDDFFNLLGYVAQSQSIFMLAFDYANTANGMEIIKAFFVFAGNKKDELLFWHEEDCREDYSTALFLAVKFKCYDLADWLISIAGSKKKDLLFCQNLYGNTVLHRAATFLDYRMVEIILKASGDDVRELASMTNCGVYCDLTAFDIIAAAKKEGAINDFRYEKLENLFKQYNAL